MRKRGSDWLAWWWLSLMKFSLIYLDVRIGCARLDVIILHTHTHDVSATNPIIAPSALRMRASTTRQNHLRQNHNTTIRTGIELQARPANSLKHSPSSTHLKHPHKKKRSSNVNNTNKPIMLVHIFCTDSIPTHSPRIKMRKKCVPSHIHPPAASCTVVWRCRHLCMRPSPGEAY